MTQSLNIVFLMRALDFGGAERQLVLLAKSLKMRGHRITVITFYSGGDRLDELKQANIPVISLEKKSRWDLAGFFMRLRRALKQLNPEILHAYIDAPNLLALTMKPFLPHTKIVWGIRDTGMDTISAGRHKQYDWLSRIAARLQYRLSRYADLIIANSKAGAAIAIAKGMPKEKMQVIPNGIDTQVFYPDDAAGKRIRAELEIAEHEIVIGIVARLDPMKDHKSFLKAAKILSSRYPQLRFVCVGDGPAHYAEELRQFSSTLQLDKVLKWLGRRNDMPAIYNAIDIIASTSCAREGFSNVIGEAMACGVPCVVTDVGDSAWIVANQSAIVPARDTDALVRALALMIEKIELRQEWASQCREQIIHRFTVERLVARTEASLIHLVRCAP